MKKKWLLVLGGVVLSFWGSVSGATLQGTSGCSCPAPDPRSLLEICKQPTKRQRITLKDVFLSYNPQNCAVDIQRLRSEKDLYLNIEGGSLEPLKGLENLQHLGLTGGDLCGFAVLPKLTGLRYLSLSRVTSCEPFVSEPIPSLTTLRLWSPHPVNLAEFEKLTSLTTLSLVSLGLTDLTGFPQFPRLETLDLKGNRIKRLGGLAHLKRLKSLDLSDNLIQDLGPQKGLSKNVGSNGLTDLTGFPRFPRLETLNLQSNRIRRLGGLAHLNSLKRLDLSYNQIQDLGAEKGLSLDPLKNLPKLQVLKIPYTAPKNYRALEEMPSLVHLVMNNTNRKQRLQLPKLGRSKNLRFLDAEGNFFTDLSGISQNTALEEVRLSRNPITSLRDLRKLTNLKALWLDSTEVVDLTGAQWLEGLKVLSFRVTKVADLTPLSRLNQLVEVDGRDSLVTDLSPLEGISSLYDLNFNRPLYPQIHGFHLRYKMKILEDPTHPHHDQDLTSLLFERHPRDQSRWDAEGNERGRGYLPGYAFW